MDLDQEFKTHIFRILNARKLNVDEKNFSSFSNKVFSRKDGTERTMVFLMDVQKLGVTPLSGVKYELSKNKATNAIVVIEEGITPSAKSQITLLQNEGITLTWFTYLSVKVDILNHKYQPKFITLNKKEKEQLLKNYKFEKLPCMKFEDPVSQYLALKVNDIVKIQRKTGDIYYRKITKK